MKRLLRNPETVIWTSLGHLHALPVQDADLKRFPLLAPIGDPVGRQLVRARETVRICLAR